MYRGPLILEKPGYGPRLETEQDVEKFLKDFKKRNKVSCFEPLFLTVFVVGLIIWAIRG